MKSLKKDKEWIEEFRNLVRQKEKIDPDILMDFADKYEETMQLAEVSFEMINQLVHKMHVNKSV